MPTPKQKRIIVLQSGFEGPTDEGDALAAGRLLRGDRGDDVLRAGSGDGWWIEGRGGSDSLFGGDGDDLLIARRALLGDDPDDGEADADNAVGAVTDRPPGGGSYMEGGRGDDLLLGGDGDDSLWGTQANDSLYGFEGDDVLEGGAADDLLVGGAGNNTLKGGHQFDTASFADLAYERGAGRVAGIVLNLSGDLIRYDSGDRRGDATILVADAAGAFVLLGEGDTAPAAGLRPEGASVFDVADGTGAVPVGLAPPAIQTVSEGEGRTTIEQFEGTLGDADAVVLDAGFAFVGTTADGFDAWSNGVETLGFKGFEVVLIA